MSLYKELRELCDDKLKFKDFKKTIKNILKGISDDKFREEAKQGNEKLEFATLTKRNRNLSSRYMEDIINMPKDMEKTTMCLKDMIESFAKGKYQGMSFEYEEEGQVIKYYISWVNKDLV
jgi:hypothetical protein